MMKTGSRSRSHRVGTDEFAGAYGFRRRMVRAGGAGSPRARHDCSRDQARARREYSRIRLARSARRAAEQSDQPIAGTCFRRRGHRGGEQSAPPCPVDDQGRQVEQFWPRGRPAAAAILPHARGDVPAVHRQIRPRRARRPGRTAADGRPPARCPDRPSRRASLDAHQLLGPVLHGGASRMPMSSSTPSRPGSGTSVPLPFPVRFPDRFPPTRRSGPSRSGICRRPEGCR